MWTSCTRHVRVVRHVDVNLRQRTERRRRHGRSAPPSAARAARASCSPSITFSDLPLVEIATATSPARPSAFDLPREDPVEPVVVGHARQRAGVGGQRDRRHAGAIPLEPSDQLRREVLRVRRTPAVAERQHLAAGRVGRRSTASAARTTADRSSERTCWCSAMVASSAASTTCVASRASSRRITPSPRSRAASRLRDELLLRDLQRLVGLHRRVDLHRVVLAQRDSPPSRRASGCAAGRDGRRS